MTIAMELPGRARRSRHRPTTRPGHRSIERTSERGPRSASRSGRPSRAVYRRRRMAAALLAGATLVVALRLADVTIGGELFASASERLVTVIAFVGWGWAALALLRWDRPRSSAAGAESGESCRSLDPTPSLPLAS